MADGSALRDFLARTARRLGWLESAEGAAVGFAVAAALALAGWPARGAFARPVVAGLIVAAAAVIVRGVVARFRRPPVATLVERAAPESRNLVFTAAELLAGPPSGSASTRGLVLGHADALAARLDSAALFPASRAVALLAASLLLWSAALAGATDGSLVGLAATTVPTVDRVDVAIMPPAYAATPERSLRDPIRIEALVGSRVRLTARSNADAVSFATAARQGTLIAAGDGSFSTEIVADSDGFVVLEPRSAGRDTVTAGAARAVRGTRRIVGITVLGDAPPRVRIVTPGRDMMLPDGRRTLDLAIDADDDIGLSTLRIRYTKVSGSGERFTFVEGELPIAIARTSNRAWKATAKWNLAPLELEPGDMVVYRAVAADARPGALPAESDAFIAEIASVGADAAGGFAIDPEDERYALSQQMVVLKTERLLARRRTMPDTAFASVAAEIAVEQRRVRAEFVFMLGGESGEVAVDTGGITDINEEAEAELEENRGVNSGREALLRAIRSMSRASRSLNDVDVTTALAHERAAIVQLELAFSRTRIILRALAEREALDSTRRLTGDFSEAVRTTRVVAPPVAPPQVAELRGVLARASESGVDAATAAELSERVLRVNAASREMQQIASALSSAAVALGRARPEVAQRDIEAAVTGLMRAIRAATPDAPASRPALQPGAARGALNDAMRRARP